MQQSVVAVMDTEHDGEARHGLVVFSALHGFPNLMTEQLRCLLKKLGIVVKKIPATEKALFTVIQQHLFPGITAERVECLWLLRGKLKKKADDEEAKANLESNFEHAGAVLEEDDLEEIKEVIKQARKRAEGTATPATAPSAPSATAADRGAVIDREWAKLFTPPGTTLTKDARLCWRWQGFFRHRSTNPKTVTKSWTNGVDGLSEREALKFVLTELWNWYSEESWGSECPHNWDEILGAD